MTTDGLSGRRMRKYWRVDASLFKSFGIGGGRALEMRVEAVNVFNHTNWGAPVTTFTANNFMRFTPGSTENATNTPGARRVQLALRVPF